VKMCGIVGLFLKDKTLQQKLGQLLSQMLVTMRDRGPDSAGIALYGNSIATETKITIRSDEHVEEFPSLLSTVKRTISKDIRLRQKDTHAVLSIGSKKVDKMLTCLSRDFPKIRVMSIGSSIEIYKEVGLPETITRRFSIDKMTGTHGVGHTRMATESAVTTLGAHPFSTGLDQCLVHNGSLSNHNSIRRNLLHEGFRFETENDSEVAAAYLTNRMQKGATLGEALQDSLSQLDGFFTFVVGTKEGFGILRDPIACKPAVMAETERYVAFGSEYRALTALPGIDTAHIWEPEPATVYFWAT